MKHFLSIVLLLCLKAYSQEAALEFVLLRRDVWLIQPASPFESNTILVKKPGGNLLVDVQSTAVDAPLHRSLQSRNALPVRYVINSHWHPDHTQGNGIFKKSGARLIAHPAAYKRMNEGQTIEYFKQNVAAYNEAELPDSLVADSASIILDDEMVKLYHPGKAHTDGDLIVHLTKANVFHIGDIALATFYPFPELSSGADVPGMIKAINTVIELSDSQTIIVPGHGKALFNKQQLIQYRDMFASVFEGVQNSRKGGMTLAQIQAQKLTAPYDAKYSTQAINGDSFVALLYEWCSKNE